MSLMDCIEKVKCFPVLTGLSVPFTKQPTNQPYLLVNFQFNENKKQVISFSSFSTLLSFAYQLQKAGMTSIWFYYFTIIK